MHFDPMTIEYMTGVIDMTRGDADTVRDTVIIHDILNDKHSIIGYDYQIEDILDPHTPSLEWADEWERDSFNQIPGYWHWRQHKEANDIANVNGLSIEYFNDFIKRNSGEWTYPEGLNHKFTRTRPHVT